MVQRIKTVQESDLRMLGSLARSIQRVLPVTQADIDAAAALGQGWVVTRVFEVSDPLDNLRGGTQLVIRQNSILPGQNVQRVLIVSGPGGQTVVVRGTDYIALPDAIAGSLAYVKAFGGTYQGNIPQQYTQVNYVTNQASTVLDTGIIIDKSKSYEFELRVRGVTGAWYVFQNRDGGSESIFGISGSSSGQTISLGWDGVSLTSGISRTNGNIYYIKATIDAANGTKTLYVKNETANTEDTVTDSYTAGSGLLVTGVGLWGNLGSASQKVGINSDVYMARIKEDGITVMDYVPCRQVATAGFYDNVSKSFKTTTDIVADGNTEPTPDAPMDIVSNNGVLKARQQSGLPLGYTLLEYVSHSGSGVGLQIAGFNDATSEIHMGWKTDTASVSSNYQAVFTVWTDNQHNSWRMLTYLTNTEKYYVYGNSKSPATASDVALDTWHDLVCKSGQFIIDNTTYNTTVSSDLTVSTKTMTIGGSQLENYYKYVKIKRQGEWIANFVPAKRKSDGRAGLYDLINNRFIGSSTFTAGPEVSDPVEVYADGTVETIEDTIGNTATAEMLLKVGDYQDVQSIIDGVVTRNVGVKVLDGTENFETATATNCYSLTNTLGTGNFADRTIVCSHFANTPTMPSTGDRQGLAFIVNKGPEYTIAFGATTQFSTQALWKQWLADQYAAGTPVIVIYPLATPTTESVTGQTLQVTDGDNTLEITQASLTGLELEAKYQAAVSLTIQEVQDANLDNNVEVTIS